MFAKLEFFKGVNPWNGKTKHRSLNGLLVYRGDISILYLPTGHYYPGSRGPFSKYFGTSCEFWSEHFKRAKVVHTWVSVVARKLPSSLLPLKKVCVVGIQKRGGKLRARDEGKGTRCTVISPPTKSPPRSPLTPDNNCNNWHCLFTWDCYFFLKPKYKFIDFNWHLASNFSSFLWRIPTF